MVLNDAARTAITSGGVNGMGLAEYLVVRGNGLVVEADAAALLQRLAHVYLGPDAHFPPGDNHPTGLILRITPEHVGGVGPWSDRRPLLRDDGRIPPSSFHMLFSSARPHGDGRLWLRRGRSAVYVIPP